MVPISQLSDPSPDPGMGQGLLPAAAAKSRLHTHPCSQQHTDLYASTGQGKPQCGAQLAPWGRAVQWDSTWAPALWLRMLKQASSHCWAQVRDGAAQCWLEELGIVAL